MWAVEARSYGENADYFYMSGLTEAESKRNQQTVEKWQMGNGSFLGQTS